MTFPIDSLSQDHRQLGLVVAVVIGSAFGFVLERVGFGRGQKLVGQFYGNDMSVLKVIFTAIITAMFGIVLLSGVNLLDIEKVGAAYPTFLWPAAVGGFFLGVGFIVSGYCPGTSFVAMASGKLDGLVTILGIIIGTVAYSELQVAIPALGNFHSSSYKGPFFLSQLLHLPRAVVAFLVLLLAVGMFAAAHKIERAVRGRPLSGSSGTPAPIEREKVGASQLA